MDLEFSLMQLERILENKKNSAETFQIQEHINSNILELVKENKKKILSEAKKLHEDHFFRKPTPPILDKNEDFLLPPPRFLSPNHEEYTLLEDKGEIYIYLRKQSNNFLFRYTNKEYSRSVYFVRGGYLVFIITLVLLYMIIRKNIKSLKTLQNSLKEYERGIVDTTKTIDGKDEVSEVSKQFYKLVSKLENIGNSRKLFLRNMMHELKTPLTKSKLYLGLIEESELRDSLELSLNKLEYLIDDMANIEKISTDNVVIEKKEYRLIDLVDNAMDMLFMNNKCITTGELDTAILCVDFKLFSIVLKNLIDNGIKYSTDHAVYINHDDHKIYISSSGERLQYDFEEYLEPFFKGTLNEINKKGFGLGLYIVHEILLKHGFSLLYAYQDNKNIFIIDYSNHSC